MMWKDALASLLLRALIATIPFAVAFFLCFSLIAPLYFRIIPYGNVRCLTIGPGEVFIAVLPVSLSLLLAIRDPFGLYTPAIGGIITHFRETAYIS